MSVRVALSKQAAHIAAEISQRTTVPTSAHAGRGPAGGVWLCGRQSARLCGAGMSVSAGFRRPRSSPRRVLCGHASTTCVSAVWRRAPPLTERVLFGLCRRRLPRLEVRCKLLLQALDALKGLKVVLVEPLLLGRPQAPERSHLPDDLRQRPALEGEAGRLRTIVAHPQPVPVRHTAAPTLVTPLFPARSPSGCRRPPPWEL